MNYYLIRFYVGFNNPRLRGYEETKLVQADSFEEACEKIKRHLKTDNISSFEDLTIR